MGAKSRRKGKAGELEVVKLAKEAGFEKAERTAPMQAGHGHSPDHDDIGGVPGLAIEVKRMAKVPVTKLAPQYCAQRRDGKVGVLIYRQDGEDHYAVMRADELLRLVQELNGTRTALALLAQTGGVKS